MWPPDAELIAAWQCLVNDPDSAGSFATLVLQPLESDLTRQFPRTDSHSVTEAADVAVASFVRKPTTYDPTKRPLPVFLRLIARRDLINQLQKDRKHYRGRIPWESVELALPDGNEECDSFADYPAIQTAIEELPLSDRQVLELLRDGERDTAAFAEVLGLSEHPVEVQAEEVKRVKDRIKARLRRAGGGR